MVINFNEAHHSWDRILVIHILNFKEMEIISYDVLLTFY